MLESLKPFTGFMTAAAVLILLVVFRVEVRKLVDWLVQFKRIAKTKEGYALESVNEPDKAPVPVLDAARDAVKAADSISPPPEPGARDTWFKALSDSRFDDAVSLAEAEEQRTTDPDKRVNIERLVGYIKFQQDPAAGVEYFEKLIREHPTRDRPYDWLASSYLWRDLPEKCLAVIERGLSAARYKARLLHTKSDCLLRLGQVDDAIAAALQGVQDDASYVTNYQFLARLHLKKGDKETARKWHLRVLARQCSK